jgi:hypothetical protein
LGIFCTALFVFENPNDKHYEIASNYNSVPPTSAATPSPTETEETSSLLPIARNARHPSGGQNRKPILAVLYGTQVFYSFFIM